MAEDMFRAPIHRSISKLDRSLFNKTIKLEAARVLDDKHISTVRSRLGRSRDLLVQDRISNIRSDPDSSLAALGRKCVLLDPLRSSRDTASVSSRSRSDTLQELVNEKVVQIIPFDLTLDYDHWTYHDIISAVLPEDELGEIPSGFTHTGHVAHLNIRDQYLPYKHLIGELVLDKNPSLRTVINKIDDVGQENEFRTFKYELLAGEDDMNVTTTEESCTFQFDFSKVYWNSRLNTEHRRIVSMFKKGEAVCDVMAGIGPFAVPAGKKKVFVWANDLNPDSYHSLQDAIQRNKVQDFVTPFNTDARSFIRDAALRLWRSSCVVGLKSRPSRKDPQQESAIIERIHRPKTFQHFVMNLPASALSFLPCFIGLYPPEIHESLGTNDKMPLVHVYCFGTKSDDNAQETLDICAKISDLLEHHMQPGLVDDGHVEIHDVRDVAPKKRMFCASFRLPQEVAFRNR